MTNWRKRFIFYSLSLLVISFIAVNFLFPKFYIFDRSKVSQEVLDNLYQKMGEKFHLSENLNYCFENTNIYFSKKSLEEEKVLGLYVSIYPGKVEKPITQFLMLNGRELEDDELVDTLFHELNHCVYNNLLTKEELGSIKYYFNNSSTEFVAKLVALLAEDETQENEFFSETSEIFCKKEEYVDKVTLHFNDIVEWNKEFKENFCM